MSQHVATKTDRDFVDEGSRARSRLLADLPVSSRRVELAGIETTLLEGGSGEPLVLLHGPGEFGGKWLRVIPHLVQNHRVIAPDLPAHGDSGVGNGPLDAPHLVAWLGELVDHSCATPPAIVGHVLGGAIAARFGIERGSELRRLVLVDSLGLARFRPRPRFAASMIGFQLRPNERSYERFMGQCSYNLDELRDGLGDRWEPWQSSNVSQARSPKSKAVGRMMRGVGLPRIAERDLAAIEVPTTLIWGEHDRANRLKVAERASERLGWPLHVIEDCADDPARDQPQAFLKALGSALAEA